jgi:hypothetical protein
VVRKTRAAIGCEGGEDRLGMSINHNDAAEALLSRRDFRCEAEPEWIDGRVPDFLCTGRAEFWAEVKSLDDPDEERLLNRFTRLLEREDTVEHDGRVLAMVSDDASDKDFKVALAIVNQVLASPQTTRRLLTRSY